MIDSMFQVGTDAALDDQVRRPRAPQPQPPAFSVGDLLKAPFQGVGGAGAKTMAFGADLLGAFGQVGGAYPELMGALLNDEQKQQAEAQRQALTRRGIDWSSDVGDTLRARGAEIMPDPQTTHTSAQVVAGLFEFGTQALGYTALLGPGAGALALGGDVGMAEADRLKQAGVDEATRTKAAAVAGTLAGGSVAVPLGGAQWWMRFLKGAAVGEGTIVGQALAERAILRNAGYDRIADSFDPLDPVALALGVVPGVLGAMHAPRALPRPLKTTADLREATALTPAEQARSAAFEASAGNLAELEAAIAAEKNPQNKAALQAELDKQRHAALDKRAADLIRSDPDVVAAARVKQAADALDARRLSADGDLAGMQGHVRALDLAMDQIGRGERVDVVAAQPAVESRRLLQAWDEVRGDPIGPADDPLVRLTPDDVQAVLVERGPVAPGADGVTVRAGDYGLVKFIWKHGPERAAVRAITRDDLADLPMLMREREPTVATVNGTEQLTWAVDRPDGRRVVYGTTRFIAGGEHHLVTVHVDELKKAPPSDKRMPSASSETRALQAAGPDTAGGTFLSSSPEDVRGQTGIVSPHLSAAAGAGETARAGTLKAEVQAAAAQEAARINPDLMVQLDGMEHPMRVGDLLEAARLQAADAVLDARLVDVAVACALRT